MTTPVWSPAVLYAPGSLVVPRTPAQSGAVELANGNFEAGLAGWSVSGMATLSASGGFTGPAAIRTTSSGEANDGGVTSEAYAVAAGQRITLSAMGRIASGTPGTGFAVALLWYDENHQMLPATEGAMLRMKQIGTAWRQATVVGMAPARARYVRVQGVMNVSASVTTSDIYMDGFSWNYISPVLQGLMYRAVQKALGLSGSVEPAWPSQLGLQVIDNEVIWEAVSISRVVWEARPIMMSGPTEPAWPLVDGGRVIDGTVSWLARTNRITDPNCPNKKEVVIAASKVFAGDRDVVRYSATLSPTDWSTPKDAGYLPTGMNQNGANHVSGLNIYRGNLIVLNATGFQQWQIDPDPAMMDLLDEMSGVGSRHHLAAQPVANDLFYLANIGVRTLGISGATNNLRAGDIGMPVDVLVQERMAAMLPGEVPLGTYYPSAGQYWLIFNKLADAEDIKLCPTLQPGERHAEAFVYVLSQSGQVGAWSRFVFPFAIDDVTHQGDDLFVRDGDTVLRLSEEIGACDLYEDAGGGDGGGPSGHPFWAEMQTHWLDMGQPGREKSLDSFDLIGYGKAEIAFAYAQEAPDVITGPIKVNPDTLRGDTVPIPLTAPSLSVRIRYSGWDPNDPDTDINRYWGFNALGIYMR